MEKIANRDRVIADLKRERNALTQPTRSDARRMPETDAEKTRDWETWRRRTRRRMKTARSFGAARDVSGTDRRACAVVRDDAAADAEDSSKTEIVARPRGSGVGDARARLARRLARRTTHAASPTSTWRA